MPLINMVLWALSLLAPCQTDYSTNCTVYNMDMGPQTFYTTSDPGPYGTYEAVIDWRVDFPELGV